MAYIFGAHKRKPFTISIEISLSKAILLTVYILLWRRTDLATQYWKILKYINIALSLKIVCSKGYKGKNFNPTNRFNIFISKDFFKLI
jgi:hypothetical protein